MEVAGLRREEVATSIEVWADNLLAYKAYNSMATQWRYRPNGMERAAPVGLDYNSVPIAFRMAGIPRSKWDEVLPDLAVMEAAALELFQWLK